MHRVALLLTSSLALGLAACATAPPAWPGAASQVFAASEPEQVFADPARRAKIAAAYPAIAALAEAEVREHELPGLDVGVVVDGELAWSTGVGFTDLDTKRVPDADTIYRIASISKSFTALAVLSLRDEGALSLDDPLTRFVPEAAGLVYPTRDTPPLTLRQLLTHTSGLPRAPRSERPGLTEPALVQSLAGFALEHAPATTFTYSNLGFGLLGVVVRRAAHASLHDVVRQRIWKPLGMTSTSYDPASLPAERVATPYRRTEAGALERIVSPASGVMESAGGVFASLRDLGRWVGFQLDAYPPRSGPERGRIRRSTVREAHLSAIPSDPIHVALRRSHAEGESRYSAIARAYGYGWVVDSTCDLARVVWHNGGVVGYGAVVGFVPESGVGVVALVNYAGPDHDITPFAQKALLVLRKYGGLGRRVTRGEPLAPGDGDPSEGVCAPK